MYIRYTKVYLVIGTRSVEISCYVFPLSCPVMGHWLPPGLCCRGRREESTVGWHGAPFSILHSPFSALCPFRNILEAWFGSIYCYQEQGFPTIAWNYCQNVVCKHTTTVQVYICLARFKIRHHLWDARRSLRTVHCLSLWLHGGAATLTWLQQHLCQEILNKLSLFLRIHTDKVVKISSHYFHECIDHFYGSESFILLQNMPVTCLDLTLKDNKLT